MKKEFQEAVSKKFKMELRILDRYFPFNLLEHSSVQEVLASTRFFHMMKHETFVVDVEHQSLISVMSGRITIDNKEGEYRLDSSDFLEETEPAKKYVLPSGRSVLFCDENTRFCLVDFRVYKRLVSSRSVSDLEDDLSQAISEEDYDAIS